MYSNVTRLKHLSEYLNNSLDKFRISVDLFTDEFLNENDKFDLKDNVFRIHLIFF